MSTDNANVQPNPKHTEDIGIAEAIEDVANATLASEHREYLLQRHKTLTLEPLPSADPADPLNWPSWKKNANLALVAFHGMVATGGTVGVVPAFAEFAKEYHKSITDASYLGTVPLLVLALAPLFWIPIANRIGRRPIWITTVLLAGLFNVGNALINSYSAHMIMRILVAMFISPGISLGQGVVVETFFKSQRARKMGIWTFAVNAGVPLGPFVMGFVVQHKPWQWMYWIMAIINFAQFVLYTIFGPETLYLRGINRTGHLENQSAFRQQYLALGRINRKHLRIREFLEPLFMLRHRNIFIATVAYSVVFNFVFVMLPVEMSILFATKFHLDPQQTGLNYMGLFVGSVLGEQIGGRLTDYFFNRQTVQRNSSRQSFPEDRLVIAQLGLPFIIAGIVVFLVQLANANPLHWNITPTIGTGVAAFGMQIVSTVLITYCSDCYPGEKSASIGVTINFVRLTWSFIGPFWYSHMIASCGLRGSAGLVSGLIIVFSILPLLLLQVTRMRSSRSEQYGAAGHSLA